MNLTLIYRFHSLASEEGEFSAARYQIVYCFSGGSFLETQELKKMASMDSDLSFLNYDDLKNFSLELAAECDEDEVRLISVQDFNIGIDGAKDISSFRQIFLSFGEVVRREGTGRRKTNFLSRFFK